MHAHMTPPENKLENSRKTFKHVDASTPTRTCKPLAWIRTDAMHSLPQFPFAHRLRDLLQEKPCKIPSSGEPASRKASQAHPCTRM